MRHWLWLLLLLVPTAVQAQWCPGITTQLTPFNTETLPITNTVASLTVAKYKPVSGSPATMAVLSLEGGDIRYQVIGMPTATDGHPLSGTPAQTFTICGLDSIAAFKAIRQASTDAIVYATYYRTKTP